MNSEATDFRRCCTCRQRLTIASFWHGDRRCRQCRKRPCATQVDPPPTRVCRICGEEKLIAKFEKTTRRRDGRTFRCNACKAPCSRKDSVAYVRLKRKTAIRNRAVRREQKLALINQLGGRCAHCGLAPSVEWPVECFDFHHRNPAAKMFDFARRLPNRSEWDKLASEASGCDVLCANCHRRETARLKA